MKTLNITSKNQSKRNTTRVVVLLVLLVLSSMGVFGQNASEKCVEETTVIKLEADVQVQNNIASVESQIDFVGWFMGSKYNQNTSEFTAESGKKISSPKKQILSSGIEPNRVLYRTFVKKVMNKDHAIA